MLSLTLLLSIFAAPTSSTARLSRACEQFTVPMTRATRASDVRLLRAAGHPVRPAKVSFELADRRWRIIWAEPDNEEQGVFFFRRTGRAPFSLVDVWGGISDGLEREELAAWARQLKGGGPPEALTQCFASALASEQ